MLQKIEIPEYLREIELSKARQAKYYEYGKKHPTAKKYKDEALYEYRTWPGFGKRKFLVEIETELRVIANPKVVGTPRKLIINGQKIYNGEVSKHIRNKVLKEIKDSFKPYIEQLEFIDKFPIRIECEIHDVIRESHSLWDLDNRAWPYIKAFQDCLTGNRGQCKKVLEDDNVMYVTQAPVPRFIPVDTEDERKLIFIIKKETDKRVLNHKGYKTELKQLKDAKQDYNTV